jgi:hypothetical protein
LNCSIYKGWVANKRTNNVPTYKITSTPQEEGDPLSLFDHDIKTPGLWNQWFNVCGDDNPNTIPDPKNPPPDVELVYHNMLAAGKKVSGSPLVNNEEFHTH